MALTAVHKCSLLPSLPPSTLPTNTPVIPLFPAMPRAPTLGSNHGDNHQQQEAEAQGEEEEVGPREGIPQEGLGGSP